MGLAACSDSSADEIDYAVDGTLTTYNTNTVAGAASAGPQAFARALTGFAYHGPEGQVVADNDFGSVSVVGRAPLVLDYVISDKAVYSDGKPITCDDHGPGLGRAVGPLSRIRRRQPSGLPRHRLGGLRTGPEAGPGVVRPGSRIPRLRASVRGDLADARARHRRRTRPRRRGVATALQNGDQPTIDRIAKAWNTVWDLKPDLDLKKFPSSGPYRIDSVSKDGVVVLVANDKWWGTPAITNRIEVWPRGADIQERVNEGSFDVVDIESGSSGLLNLPDDYVSTETPSAGIEQLIFAPGGPLAATPARRAVALCTPAT